MAVQLRASKMTYEKIAAQCGYANASTARKAIMRELNRTVVKNVEHLRYEELNTLDVLQAECFTRMQEGGDYAKSKLFAVDRILAIMERRAKLMGLDQSADGAIAAAQVIIREVPGGYLTGPES